MKAMYSPKKAKHKLCPLVNDIKNSLMKLLNGEKSYHIKFTWCPSHVGIDGNERADREAKEAALSGVNINNKIDYLQLAASMFTLYGIMDDAFLNSLNTSAGKFYFENFKHLNLTIFIDLSLNRKKASIIIRLISGYSFTGSYLFKMGIRDTPSCDCEALCQDVNHLLFESKNFDEHRFSLYKNLIELKVFPLTHRCIF